MREEITQAEYDRSVTDHKPLLGSTEESREIEKRQRDQLLLDRIYAYRQEVAAVVRRAKQLPPLDTVEDDPWEK